MQKKTKFSFRSKTLKTGFIFLLSFLLFFLIIFLLLSLIPLQTYINYFYGVTSNFILNVIFGIASSFSFDWATTGGSVILISSLDYPVYISFLCTGILELSVLLSAILATKTVSWKKRLYGVLIAMGVVGIFNIIRISFTTFLITRLNIGVADFFHSFLFRLFMVIIILGTYYLWLRIATKQKVIVFNKSEVKVKLKLKKAIKKKKR